MVCSERAVRRIAEFGQLEGVREKQRLSFRYKMWRFDLTVVRGAPCADFRLIDAARQPPSPLSS